MHQKVSSPSLSRHDNLLAALSAYNYFCSKVRQEIKEEMPGIANTEIMKVAATRWKALSVEDRAPFERLAAEDKTRYLSPIVCLVMVV